MIYYSATGNAKGYNAGGKAPSDISQICYEMGFIPIYFPNKISSKKISEYLEVGFKSIVVWIKTINNLNCGDYFIYQHPMSAMPITMFFLPILKRKKVKIISLIHDLQSLRAKMSPDFERQKKYDSVLEFSDYIIGHNNSMNNYLVETGYEKEKLLTLELFDYIVSDYQAEQNAREKYSVVIAGNLAKSKSGYIYKLNNIECVTFNLYGANFSNQDKSNNLNYKGSFKPEELPGNLDGGFGLVWDGPEISTCAGETGEYLKYNNPHKCSLYLAAGIPVFVWSQSALAEFIVNNDLGFAINSINDIPKILGQIDDSRYQEMIKNVEEYKLRIRNGYFTKNAFKKIGLY